MDDLKRTMLANLPGIDTLLLKLDKEGRMKPAPRELVKSFCREAVEEMRRLILAGSLTVDPAPESLAELTAVAVAQKIADLHRLRLRKVVNATGVVLHTNLGRAPLCREAVARVRLVSEGYSNLEYDLERGNRGLRYDHVHRLLCALTGAEDALVVNNNAAAVLLVLDTLARGREVVVSRGELVEIGGEFRVPDVMAKSGARLREVGTTNRTRLADYEGAIGPETALLMKVHTSNYRIVGFTEEVALGDLVRLGRRHAVSVMVDLGSGCLIDLGRYGLAKEPLVQEVVAAGADVVTFSGDKLLGGPQAGVILGRAEILARVKKNSLNRALRIDKMTLAALEGTLVHYLDPEGAVRDLRVLRSLTEAPEEVAKRARRLLRILRRAKPEGMTMVLRKDFSMAGGGSLPGEAIPTTVIAVRSLKMTPARLAEALRRLETPVIVRVADEHIIIDLRTLVEDEYALVRDALVEAGSGR